MSEAEMPLSYKRKAHNLGWNSDYNQLFSSFSRFPL